MLTQFLEAFLKSSSWEVADNINLHSILQSSLWDVKSVSTEELIFRGVLLYILIGKVGSRKGVMISAIAFGVYHWFSYGVIGNVMPMIFVFIGTGLMGYGWAWAFAKTKSIMLPFGLHLGWNFTYNTIFSKGPLGEMLLISHGGSELGDWASLLNFLSGLVIVPLIILAYVHLFVREKGETTSQ
ncbi:CPBP family intramembrane glutamic endopeptidase [Marivirga atlantica]|uniref:CPBP family intramembrane glutamic endopeptidase n=1 Tax=Marivirga atlantica TaxID=1548457 RepID=UPI001F1B1D48|nr:CPBP family intramembrane glutamic endopeptidase [Marivirga atlantica]